ncbi:MAG: hypothetical protein JSW33_07990, partial [bacterium]
RKNLEIYRLAQPKFRNSRAPNDNMEKFSNPAMLGCSIGQSEFRKLRSPEFQTIFPEGRLKEWFYNSV